MENFENGLFTFDFPGTPDRNSSSESQEILDRHERAQDSTISSNNSTSGSGNQDFFLSHTLQDHDYALDSLSSSIDEIDEVSEMMSTPILGDMVLVRGHKAIAVDFFSLGNAGDIQTERVEDIQTIVTESYIPEVRRNNALQYVSANWSSMQYISEFEMISFGGYDENMRVATDKTIWFDLRNMIIVKELHPMKVSRFAPLIILVGEFIYVFGGGFGLPIECTRIEAERFDTLRNSWEDLPNMTYPKRTANPSHYNNIIYLVGGLGSQHNEAYRIVQGDYIPLNITYPLPDLEEGIRSISYVIGNELVLLNNQFQQVFELEPELTCKSCELIKNYECVNVRSAVSPIDRGNMIYSTALFINKAVGERRNLFCIYGKRTRTYHVNASLIVSPNRLE